MTRSCVGWVVAAALIAAACGPGDGPSSAEAAVEHCVAKREAQLDHAAACFAWSPAYLELAKAGTPSRCEEARRSVLEGRESVDPQAAERCVRTLGAFAVVTPCADRNLALPEACRGVPTPQVAIGGACTLDADCMGGWCSGYGSTSPGTCQAVGAEGDACRAIGIVGNDAETCAPGLRCNQMQRFTCTVVTSRRDGDPCSLAEWCDDRYYCVFIRDPRTGSLERGTCAPTVDVGQPCPRGTECSPGLTCGPASVCARYVGQGGRCDAPTAVCGEGLYCDGASCAALPDLDGSCAASGRCLRGSCSAEDEVCRPVEQDGAPAPL